MITRIRYLAILIPAAAFVLLLVPCDQALSAPPNYTETFDSWQYRDSLETTADWDTVSGVLKLPPYGIHTIGSWNTVGSAKFAAVRGDYAFVADHTAAQDFIVFDISDPDNPDSIAAIGVYGDASHIALSGDYAFVSGGSYSVVVDIGNPAAPVVVDTLPDGTLSMDIDGNRAYAAAYYTSSMDVLDISDPTNVSKVGGLAAYHIYGVAVDGNRAYIARDTDGFFVANITDPSTPVEIGSLSLSGSLRAVKISGNHAFVAATDAGVHSIDISNPAVPVLVDTYDTPVSTLSLDLSGDYLYVADYSGGVVILDVTDPTSLSLVSQHDIPDNTRSVSVSGEYLFIAAEASGLHIARSTEPVEPFTVGSYATPDSAQSVTIAGDYAFVAGFNGGTHIINISDPENPTTVYTIPPYNGLERSRAVAVAGNWLFLGSRSWASFDITNPSYPQGGYTYVFGNDTYDVVVDGNYSYNAWTSFGARAFDLSNLPQMPGAGWFLRSGMTNDARGVAVDGDYLYVADRNIGLVIWDISDPTVSGSSPTGEVATPGNATKVDVAWPYAYVADDSGDLQIVDVSNPAAPFIASSVATPGNVMDVVVSGDYAYLADFYGGLRVVDISNAPFAVDVFDAPTSGPAIGVKLFGDLAYVAAGYSGVEIIRVSQRLFDASRNKAQSTRINPVLRDVLMYRIDSDVPLWIDVTADNGSHWQLSVPGSWVPFTHPGNSLKWRAYLEFEPPPTDNPSVDWIQIEWRYDIPVIESIVDVGNDQGRAVRLEWVRSGHDYTGSATAIVEYAVYRRIDEDLALTAVDRPVPEQAPAYPPGSWEFITTVPADCEENYAVSVPTVADSTIDEGMYYSAFFVRARTATPGEYFDSEPDSGWSVDNLAPHVPLGLSVAYNSPSGNELTWEECTDEDFQYFRIYRGTSEDFVPTPQDRVHMTTSTSWTDAVEEGWMYYYKVSAVDFSGNESGPAAPGTATGAETPEMPEATFLAQNCPNPFNPSTVIRFGLKEAGHVSLRIYDAAGRLVAVLVDESKPAGAYEALWDGMEKSGLEAASGVYFYRLAAGDFLETRKMILLK